MPLPEGRQQLCRRQQIPDRVDSPPEMPQASVRNFGSPELLGHRALPANEHAHLVPAAPHLAGQIPDMDAGAADRIRPRHHIQNPHGAFFRDNSTRNASLRNTATPTLLTTGTPANHANPPSPGVAFMRYLM